MKKLLSIIVPSFNMEAYLLRCLDSLGLEDMLLQDTIEVVVVNDGSKDGTSRIAHEYANRYPNAVRVIDKPNGHYGSCINAALRMINGEFVKILEPDDVYNTKDFKAFVTELRDLSADVRYDSVDVWVTDYASTNAAGEISKAVHYDYPSREVMSFNQFQQPLKYHILLPAVTYRTSIVRSQGYRQSEGCPYTDLEWLTYPMTRVRSVCYLPYSIYRYFIGREGQTVSPEALRKGVPVIIRLMRRMLGDYASLTASQTPGVKDYVDKVIGAQLGIVYRSFLLEKNPYVQPEDIHALDESVRSASPGLMARSDLVLHSRHFDFHYVREFRSRRGRKGWRFLVFDLYRMIELGTRHFR